MRVAASVVRWIAEFKSPNVISQFGSQDQFGFGEIGQVSKNGGLVKAERYQLIGELRMSLRLCGSFECIDDRDSSGRAAEPGIAKQFSGFVHFVDAGFLLRHGMATWYGSGGACAEELGELLMCFRFVEL